MRLYALEAQAEQVLIAALEPQSSGPQPRTNRWYVDQAWLHMQHRVWREATGLHRSVAYISGTLQAAGSAVRTYNDTLVSALPVLTEVHEIFQGQHPDLTVVDGRCFLGVNLSSAAARDGTTRGVMFLHSQAR